MFGRIATQSVTIIRLWGKLMRLALRLVWFTTAALTTPPSFAVLLFSTIALGQNTLPSCSTDGSESTWDNCQGTKTFATGGKYIGEFRDGKLNGHGTHTYTNGGKYVGEFKDGNFSGQGTLTTANGDKYVGEFIDGFPNGRGTQTYTNGDKYVGEFSDGKPNGIGTRTFANKSKYVGDIRNGILNGQGTLTIANGSRYVGEFKYGSPSGQGRYLAANGSNLPSEIWADRFVGAVVDQQTIKMERSGGVFYVPVRFNDIITLNAMVDSGASDVSVPADIVLTLMRTGTIKREDFLGTQTYVLADGSKVPSQQFRIRSLKVGNKTIEYVVASIASVNATILLGQSFLSKFKSWSVDNEQHTLILR
jgi:hypothetical protein